MLFTEDTSDRITAPLARAWTLPPEAYIDPAIFARERDAIFRREWQCVGRTEHLPESGSYLSATVGDQPLIVTRDGDGELRAMSGVCLHRNMVLTTASSGQTTRFVCPYHNWTYELDGRLRSAPMMDEAEGFDAESCRLPQVRIETWHGFVFVNLDTEATPLAEQLSGLEPLVANYRFEDLRIASTTRFDSPWNWKILVENFMEAYHHIGTHRGSLQPIYPARESSVPDNGGQPWVWLDMPAKAGPEAPSPNLPGLPEDERGKLFAAAVFPTFLFAASAGGGVWYELRVAAHDDMTIDIHQLLHADVVAEMSEEQREEGAAVIAAIHNEDIAANVGVWQGLNSPAAEQGRLSFYEAAIWQLNQLWMARMA